MRFAQASDMIKGRYNFFEVHIERGRGSRSILRLSTFMSMSTTMEPKLVFNFMVPDAPHGT